MADKGTETAYKRQRKQPGKRKKKKRHPVLAFFIILIVLVLLGVFGFQTKDIQITGNERVTDDKVKELIQCDKSYGNTLILWLINRKIDISSEPLLSGIRLSIENPQKVVVHVREQQIDGLGLQNDFILLGTAANPYPYYRQCDLYVHATRFEGKSLAIQEAKTLGCAVLVSNCSGNREQVTDGVDGAMCALSAEAVSQKIIDLLSDNEKRHQYGERAAVSRINNDVDIRKVFELQSEKG